MDQLADRYGSALFELACEENKVDEWQVDAKMIQASITPDTNEFFASVQITKIEKKEVLLKSFKGVHPLLLDFMCLLIDKSRFNHLHQILKSFNSICNQSKNIKEGFVYSARPLHNDKIREIEKACSLKFNGACELVNRINPQLLSGFKIVIGNEIIDVSMKNKIEKMKHELLKGVG